MKKTLYDALGVSPHAGPVAIRAAYERVMADNAPERARPETAEDFAIRLVAAREAWYVLGDENRRAVYDASLKVPAATMTEIGRRSEGKGKATMTPDEALAAYASMDGAPRPRGFGRWAIWAIALLLVLPAGWWFRLGTQVGSPEDQAARQRSEIERIEREQSEGPSRSPEEIEQDRIEREARESLRMAREARDAAERAERAERERQRELERTRQEADSVSRNLEYSMSRAEQEERNQAERARRDAERAALEDRRERDRLAAEAKRRLERDKAYLQGLEQDNRTYRAVD